MSLPDDNVVERGRAIFEQLRSAESEAPAPVSVDEADQPSRGEEGVPPPDEPAQAADVAATGSVDAGPGPADHDAGPPVPVNAHPVQPTGAGGATSDALVSSAGPTEAVQPDQTADPPQAAGPAPVPAPPVHGEEDRPRIPGPVPLGMPPEAVASLMGDETGAASPAERSPTQFARPLPRVIAIANQKGGVGKTTTAVNLGAGLAELGHRVLVVDLDPQGNATTGLGINPRNLEVSIYDVMMHDVPLEDCIEATTLRNLFVCPATIDLAGAEIELVPAFSRELKLRRALEAVLEDFDFVVVDCPPSLGLITINALAAATEVIVPIQCEYYALEGLGQLLRNVNLVQTNLNPRLEVSAIVLTMFDARTKLADQVASEVRSHFGAKVCRNIVPRTVRLSEAPSFGQPITVFDPTSRGAIAYRELAKEVAGGAPQRVG
ncbi:MAG: AAA family ATPase [Acidimicrobiales bacterium]